MDDNKPFPPAPEPTKPEDEANQPESVQVPVMTPSQEPVEDVPSVPPVVAAPMAPVAPAPTTPDVPPVAVEPAPSAFGQPAVAAVPSPNKNKGLLIGLIVGGAVLLLAGIALAVYFMFFYVSKADYKQASVATSDIKTLYGKLDAAGTEYSDAVTNEYTSDTTVEKAKTDYEKAANDYKAKVAEAKKLRALKDAKAMQRYNAFAAENNEYVAYNDTMVATMPAVRNMTKGCSSAAMGKLDSSRMNELVSQWDKALTKCNAAIAELVKSPNADAAKVGTKMQKAFGDMRTAVVEMEAAYKANDRAAFTRAYGKIDDAANSSDLQDTLSTVKKHNQSLDPTDKLGELTTYLNSKA